MNNVQTIKVLTNPAKIKRVAGYARVSTADEHQESSYRLQIEELERSILANHTYGFIGVFKDRKSGRNMKGREEFATMIELATAGEIDCIITKSITRFGRNLLETISVVRTLKEYNVEVIFQKENISTLDPSIEMILTILAMHAEEESKNISANTWWGVQRKVRKGGNITTQLYGYDIKGETWKVIPKQAAIVRLIYEMYINKDTYREIIERLKSMGVKSFHGNNIWVRGTIEDMLRNEKYAGHLATGKTYLVNGVRVRSHILKEKDFEVRNHHEPIISQEVFDKAQEVRRSRHAKFPNEYVAQADRVTEFTHFVYSEQNQRYLKYVLEKPKGQYLIPTLYCYDNHKTNRVMITVNNLFSVLNAALLLVSNNYENYISLFTSEINNALAECETRIISDTDNKIELLKNKVVFTEGKKRLLPYSKQLKNFTNLNPMTDYRKYIRNVVMIDKLTVRVNLNLLSEDILDRKIAESSLELKIGNGNKVVRFFIYI